MTYKETLDYMYSQLPMFQRIGSAAYKADLNNTYAICDLLDQPQNKFRSIHIAGTNGKGSTSHMLAAILQSSGLKTGLYTSPHLKDFRERIKINGKMITEDAVTNFITKYKNDFERIKPSFFEMTVGLAFDYFAKEKIDIAVIETGLGGRLDSTNVIDPIVSVITNISFDHQALLGDTLEKIAEEKAGIIKKNTAVVIGETQQEIRNIFLKKSDELNALIFFADENFKTIFSGNESYLNANIFKNKKLYFEKISPGLKGFYQQKNISTVLQTIEILRTNGFNITDDNIRTGLKNTVSLTGLMGRWQTLQKDPLTIADTGHNEAGIKEVLNQISGIPYKKLHFVLGMVNDKDVSKILQLLPKNAVYYFCKADIPRALEAIQLKRQAENFKLTGEIYTSVKNALEAAQRAANIDDLVFIGGSTFVVAEVV